MLKKLLVAVGIFAVLTILLAGCNATISSGSFVDHSSNAKSTSWTVSASSANGYESRTIDMSADNLSALNVVSSNSDGTVSLVITQGDNTQTVDINQQFSGNIDTSRFSPGKVELRLNYDNAKNMFIAINW